MRCGILWRRGNGLSQQVDGVIVVEIVSKLQGLTTKGRCVRGVLRRFCCFSNSCRLDIQYRRDEGNHQQNSD